MAENPPATPETKRHHFLYYIFKMDKSENLMPKNQAESLLHYLKYAFANNRKNDKGGK